MKKALSTPSLIDERALKAQSHPIRAQIMNFLSEGLSSPSRMERRMEGVSLSLVSYHVKELRKVGLIELVEIRKRGGRAEHIYRATKRQFFDREEWEAVAPRFRDPIAAAILRDISRDASRSAAEGKFNAMADRHLSRSPIELDREGWGEVVVTLEEALDRVLEAHARSKERAIESGEELMNARVVIMQFLLGRNEPPVNDDPADQADMLGPLFEGPRDPGVLHDDSSSPAGNDPSSGGD